MTGTIVVLAEIQNGHPKPVTYELLNLADQLCGPTGRTVVVVVLGSEATAAARELARDFSGRILAVVNPRLEFYNGELYKSILTRLLPPLEPGLVLAAHTTQGMDFAPGLSVRLGAECLTGVEGLEPSPDRVILLRSMYNGKIQARLSLRAPLTVVTVQPGAFKAKPAGKATRPGQVETVTSTEEPQLTRTLGLRRSRTESETLSAAEVVVAAGRGLGKKENLTLIKNTADLFPRSAVAGSRPVCDNGWLDYRQQVGLTGATVSPKLYIACGISGARQHTVGMQGSGFIVAISTDPHAAIFNLADIGVVEDLTVFLPIFIEESRKG
jgi:electron transfer flavoprotein alpha subunit